MTIHELTNALIELEAEAETGELDDAIYQDTFEGLEGAFEDKAESWAKWIRQNEVYSDGIKSEIDRLTKLKKMYDRHAEKGREVLAASMQKVGKTKFQTQLFAFGFRKSKAVEVDEGALLPEWAIEVKESVKKSEIAKKLRAGETFPWARFVENESLQIK